MTTPILRKNFLWLLLAINIIVLSAVFFVQSNRKIVVYANPQNSGLLPAYGQVANFALIEKSGQPISLESLKGRPWVASFTFIHCPGQCPAINTNLSAIQDKLPKNMHIVSFSVDPKRDTPEALSEYSKNFKAEDNKWFFLTGEKKVVDSVLESFHVNGAAEPSLHSLRCALVDSRGQIRGYYDAVNSAELNKLLDDTNTLLKEEGVGR